MRAFSGTSISQRVLHRADAGERVHHGADAADALRPDPGFARIAALQDHFDAAEHGPGTPGVGDLSAVQMGFDAKVAFNAGDWIDNEACHVILPFFPQVRQSAVSAPA